VTGKTLHGILGIHPNPIVVYLNTLNPTALDLDLDRACLGIKRILKQFLHHRSRTLNDFASSDMIDHIF
jgi:hypothetical protein